MMCFCKLKIEDRGLRTGRTWKRKGEWKCLSLDFVKFSLLTERKEGEFSSKD